MDLPGYQIAPNMIFLICDHGQFIMASKAVIVGGSWCNYITSLSRGPPVGGDIKCASCNDQIGKVLFLKPTRSHWALRSMYGTVVANRAMAGCDMIFRLVVVGMIA